MHCECGARPRAGQIERDDSRRGLRRRTSSSSRPTTGGISPYHLGGAVVHSGDRRREDRLESAGHNRPDGHEEAASAAGRRSTGTTTSGSTTRATKLDPEDVSLDESAQVRTSTTRRDPQAPVVAEDVQAGSHLRADHVRHGAPALARACRWRRRSPRPCCSLAIFIPFSYFTRRLLLPLRPAPRRTRQRIRRTAWELTADRHGAPRRPAAARTDRARTATSCGRAAGAEPGPSSSTRAVMRPELQSDAGAPRRALCRDPRRRTATSTTCWASPISPRGRERRCTCPRASARCSRPAGRYTPSDSTSAAYAPERSARRRRDGRARGDHVRGAAGSRPLAGAPGIPRRRALSSPATSCSPGRSDAPTFRAPTGRRCSPRSGCSSTRCRRHRGLPRTRPDHDAGRRARAEPVPRRPPRGAHGVSRRTEDRATARHPRRPPGRAAALAPGHVGDRAALRALRLPADLARRCSRTPRSSSGPPVPAPTSSRRRCTRSRIAAIGRSRCARRRPRRSAARTSSTGCTREPQPAKLFTIASMYRYGAPGRGTLPRALAGVGRGDRQRRSVRRRRADPALRHAAAAPRPHAATTSSSTRSAAASAARHTSSARVRGSRSNAGRLDEDARAEGCDEPAPRLRQLPGEARALSRAALDEAPKIGESLCAECVERFAVVPARPRRDAASRTARADARSRARLLLAHDLGVRRPAGRTRTRLSREAAATTTSSRRSAGRRRPASASAPESSACSSRWRPRASRTPSAPTIDVFFALDEGAPRELSPAGSPSSERRGIVGRHRLCAPLAQGPAHAGRPSRGGDDHGGRRSGDATIRRAGQPGRRPSPTTSFSRDCPR